MTLEFTKLHGLGNDYVYVGLFDQHVEDAPALARAVSERHRGVGSDGLILVAPPTVADAHVRMVMYNADGSRGEMCGNGIRCVAKLAYERGWARHNPLRVQTDRGVLSLDLLLTPAGQVARVRVDMGPPLLAPAEIPVRLAGPRVVGVTLASVAAETGEAALDALPMTCVSLGNPHAVFFVPDLAAVPLAAWGPCVEHHALFPARVNVHFAQVLRRDFIRMCTWERGSGITQACGTGAAAVCVAAVLNHLGERTVLLELPGGQLALEWDERSGHVFKTGPAIEVFTGRWPLTR
jgi:diaminopimelate epimerase